MKAHLTECSVKGLQPKQKNIIVYDEEVVGFGVRITSGGTRAFILTYGIEARERRLTVGAFHGAIGMTEDDIAGLLKHGTHVTMPGQDHAGDPLVVANAVRVFAEGLTTA